MSLLLSPLRDAPIDRHNKAAQALKDGSLTVTLTRQTDVEIHALVKKGDGIEYGVTLTEHGSSCSCPNALYRGRTCKHAVAVCVVCLQQTEQTEDKIHLMWSNGHILCGLRKAKRFWRDWTLNVLNWSDIVCQACVHVWTHPAIAEGR